MGKKYNNAISTSAGFKYNSPSPLDDRLTVETYADLVSDDFIKYVYDGMVVYVQNEDTHYKYNGSDWTEFGRIVDISMKANIETEPLGTTNVIFWISGEDTFINGLYTITESTTQESYSGTISFICNGVNNSIVIDSLPGSGFDTIYANDNVYIESNDDHTKLTITRCKDLNSKMDKFADLSTYSNNNLYANLNTDQYYEFSLGNGKNDTVGILQDNLKGAIELGGIKPNDLSVRGEKPYLVVGNITANVSDNSPDVKGSNGILYGCNQNNNVIDQIAYTNGELSLSHIYDWGAPGDGEQYIAITGVRTPTESSPSSQAANKQYVDDLTDELAEKINQTASIGLKRDFIRATSLPEPTKDTIDLNTIYMYQQTDSSGNPVDSSFYTEYMAVETSRNTVTSSNMTASEFTVNGQPIIDYLMVNNTLNVSDAKLVSYTQLEADDRWQESVCYWYGITLYSKENDLILYIKTSEWNGVNSGSNSFTITTAMIQGMNKQDSYIYAINADISNITNDGTYWNFTGSIMEYYLKWEAVGTTKTELANYALKSVVEDSIDALETTKANKNQLLTYTISTTKKEVTITDCDASTINVVIPETIEGYPVTTLSASAFKDCTALASVILPDSLTKITRNGSFSGCTSLTSIVIPKNIAEITTKTFYNCTALSSVYIPKNVTKINSNAFFGCTVLADIYYEGSESDWNSIEILTTGNDSIKNATKHYNQEAASKEYIINSLTETNNSINTRIEDINTNIDNRLTYKVVNHLPDFSLGDIEKISNTLFLVPNNSGNYDEYICIPRSKARETVQSIPSATLTSNTIGFRAKRIRVVPNNNVSGITTANFTLTCYETDGMADDSVITLTLESSSDTNSFISLMDEATLAYGDGLAGVELVLEGDYDFADDGYHVYNGALTARLIEPTYELIAPANYATKDEVNNKSQVQFIIWEDDD